MKNPFKKNKHLRTLRALSASFAILDEFERRGILHYHRPKVSSGSPAGSLLIEESLATLKLAEGADGFKHFLEQVAQWQNYRLLQEAYEAHRIDTEARAVREARKKYANLTKADVQRIRQNARDNMSEIDISNLPSLLTGGAGGGSEFDLFIIRATAPSAEEAINSPSLPNGRGQGGGSLLALGHWDGKKLEMALYDDIRTSLQQ